MSELLDEASGTRCRDDGYRYADAVSITDPIASGTALLVGERAPWLLYENSGEVAVALGSASQVVLTRDEVEFHGRDGSTHREPVGDRPLDQVGRLLRGCGIPDWRAYGWCSFELCHLLQGRPEEAGNGPLVHLFVPEREVLLSAGRAVVRALDADGLAELSVRLCGLVDPPLAFRLGGGSGLVDQEAGADRYRRVVARAIDEIHDGVLGKVILSRIVPVPGGVDLLGTFRSGRDGNTPARSFALDLGGMRAAGFSPETVVEVSGDGLVSTQPLAGTRALHDDAVRDAALGRELAGDPKEVYEHAISVHAAQRELREFCVTDSVVVRDFMAVNHRGSVQHLASRLTGRLAPGHDAWRALAGLFPAITASGVPKAEACLAISRHEDGPRRLYAGAVLTASSDGALDAALVLRTVFDSGGHTWLRAGAGIVGQSTPERELEETREKLRSVSRFLVPPRSSDDAAGPEELR